MLPLGAFSVQTAAHLSHTCNRGNDAAPTCSPHGACASHARRDRGDAAESKPICFHVTSRCEGPPTISVPLGFSRPLPRIRGGSEALATPGAEARWERGTGEQKGVARGASPSSGPPSDSLPPWEVDGGARPVGVGRLSITQVRRKEPLVSRSASRPGRTSYSDLGSGAVASGRS